jgi:hypothetical protein
MHKNRQFRDSWNSGKIPGHFVQFQKFGNFDKKKTVFYRIRSAQYPQEIQGQFWCFSGHNAQNLVKKKSKKVSKKLKKHPKTPKFVGFFAIHSCGDLLKIEKVEIWKIPVHSLHLFFRRIPGGKIGVFGLSTSRNVRRKSGVFRHDF